jgi:hypothetical protein
MASSDWAPSPRATGSQLVAACPTVWQLLSPDHIKRFTLSENASQIFGLFQPHHDKPFFAEIAVV